MIRSYLFVPGNRPERFAKALASGAGAVILDLEDAVPPEAKASARDAVCRWLREHPDSAWVRVNGADTELFQADVDALREISVDGFVLPKAEAPVALPGPVIPIIESAAGLWNALEVARGPRVERLAFGSVDFQLDTGIQGDDEALLYARSQLVLVSRGLAPSEDQLRWARAVVSAFEGAAGNAVRLEGKLIDLPVVERAKRLLL